MEQNTQKGKKTTPRSKFTMVIVLLLLIGIAYMYFWYKGVQKRDLQARELIAQSQAYAQIVTDIEDELTRCKDLITFETGTFGDFEYCKKFINWAGRYIDYIENVSVQE